MPENTKPVFHIEPATEDDWPWIVQKQIEAFCALLSADRRERAGRGAVEQRVADHVLRVHMDETFHDQAFIAWASDGARAGFIWVARSHNDFTGELEASLLYQFVAKPYRGSGLGGQLMAAAEDWARQQGLVHISLSVGVDNRIAQHLYQSLGYRPEAIRMSKDLISEDNGGPRLPGY